MKFISLLALAMTATQAQAAATTTYSGIFTATSAISFVTLADAKNDKDVETGICIGGTTYCGVFSGSNACPSIYCQTEFAPVDPSKPVSSNDPNTDTCVASTNNPGGQVPCANLPEYQCNEATNRFGYTHCKFVRISGNQRAINAVLVAFTTTSLVVLLVIAVMLHRRLPKKGTVLTQPLLDEENAE